jgi:hypothetical protein
MTIKVKELRCRYVCPKCNKDVWFLVIDGEFEPEKQECWNCHTTVEWKLEINEPSKSS